MCCGVTHNAYHTLRSMKFMLPSGTNIDTGQADSELRPSADGAEALFWAFELKTRIERDTTLAERIRAKYPDEEYDWIFSERVPRFRTRRRRSSAIS